MKELVFAVLGGIITYAIQRIYESIVKRKQANVDVVINPGEKRKALPSDILMHIYIGISLEKVKDILGVPDSSKTTEYFELLKIDEKEVEIRSYFFKFRNISLRVLSTDNQTVDAISLFSYGNEKPIIEGHTGFYEPIQIGLSTIAKELVDGPTGYFCVNGHREQYFGLENYYGRLGEYRYYTFFGSFVDPISVPTDTENINPEIFIGETITGSCVSNIQGYASYISMYE